MISEKAKPRAIGYIRVASDDKNRKERFEYQSNLVEKCAQQEGFELVEIFEEVGDLGNVLHEAVEFCETEGDIAYFIVTDLTRLSRDANEAKLILNIILDLGIEVQEALPRLVNKFMKDIFVA